MVRIQVGAGAWTMCQEPAFFLFLWPTRPVFTRGEAQLLRCLCHHCVPDVKYGGRQPRWGDLSSVLSG